MNGYYIAGVVCRILFGLVLVAVVLKVTKTDGRMKCEYDERQMVARGRGYKYGFFTFIVCALLYGFCAGNGAWLPLDPGASMFLLCVVAITVHVSYCIWNDAYFALNENRGSVLIAFLVIGAANLLIGVTNVVQGNAVRAGQLTMRGANLFCGVLFLLFFGVLLAKHLTGEETE